MYTRSLFWGNNWLCIILIIWNLFSDKKKKCAVKRLIASKIKVFIYIIYVCERCIFIMYIPIHTHTVYILKICIGLLIPGHRIPRLANQNQFSRKCHKSSNRSYSANVSKEADDGSARLFILLFLVASDSCTSKMVIDHYKGQTEQCGTL